MRTILALLIFLIGCGETPTPRVVERAMQPAPSPTPSPSETPKFFKYLYLIEVADEYSERSPELLKIIINASELPPLIEDEIGWRCLKLEVLTREPLGLKYVERVKPEDLNKICQGRLSFTPEELVSL